MTLRLLCFGICMAISITGCVGDTSRSRSGDPPVLASPLEGAKITVKGTIAFTTVLGGYYVAGEDPAGEFMISNQNVRLLQALRASGKTVTIEGRLPMGADLLIIDMIDGRPYEAKTE